MAKWLHGAASLRCQIRIRQLHHWRHWYLDHLDLVHVTGDTIFFDVEVLTGSSRHFVENTFPVAEATHHTHLISCCFSSSFEFSPRKQLHCRHLHTYSVHIRHQYIIGCMSTFVCANALLLNHPVYESEIISIHLRAPKARVGTISTHLCPYCSGPGIIDPISSPLGTATLPR